MRDEEIIKLYFDRDGDAVARTQEKYGAYLYTVSYDLIRNEQDAEECVNDAYSAAWNSMPPNRPAVLRTYLCKLVRNITLKRIREQSAQKRGGGEVPLVLDELRDCTAPDTVEQQLDRRRLSEAIGRFLGTLGPQHRIIFVQRYWYCCPVDEIAEELEITKSKVTVTLMRTRKKLRTYLEKEGFL